MAFCARVAGLANPRLFQPRQPMLCHYSACSIPVVGSAPLQRSGLLQQGFLRVDLHSAPSTALGRNALGPQWTCPTSCPVELEGLQAKDPPRAVSPLSGRHDGVGNLSRRTGATARRRVEVKVIAMKMSSGRLEGYVVPQAFQLAHRAAGNGVAIPLFEVMIAQVHIVLAPVSNAVADDGDAVGHRQGSPIGPDAAGQASVLGAQIGLGASGGFGRFHQGCFQPGIAFARRTALALFALCLLPGQTPAQGARCPAVGKGSHRDAHFGSNDLGGAPSHPGDGVQGRYGVRQKGAAAGPLPGPVARSGRPSQRCAPAGWSACRAGGHAAAFKDPGPGPTWTWLGWV